MTPQEKATELYLKYEFIYVPNYTSSFEVKQCALIAVEEILNHHSQEQGLYRIDTYYWQQVKAEIEKL